ncbi:MAG: DUF4271 domain-containing protein [Rikenellaceae bacterium]|nr:DUF4271 domain-containing protein [Rikenellaceae bacterium]
MIDTLKHNPINDLAVQADTLSPATNIVECADSVWIGGGAVATEAIPMLRTSLEVLLSDPLMQSVLLVLTLTYLTIMCRRFGEAIEMSSWLVLPSTTTICEEHADRRMGLSWRLLGLATLGCFAIMLLYTTIDTEINLPSWVVISACIVGVTLVWGAQKLLLSFSGEAVLQHRFTKALTAIRCYTVEMAGVWLTPLVVGCALSSGAMSVILWWIVVIIGTILALIHLLKILNLFIGSGFSIFYLILYLCAVEIFPTSLAVAVTLRIL